MFISSGSESSGISFSLTLASDILLPYHNTAGSCARSLFGSAGFWSPALWAFKLVARVVMHISSSPIIILLSRAVGIPIASLYFATVLRAVGNPFVFSNAESSSSDSGFFLSSFSTASFRASFTARDETSSPSSVFIALLNSSFNCIMP